MSTRGQPELLIPDNVACLPLAVNPRKVTAKPAARARADPGVCAVREDRLQSPDDGGCSVAGSIDVVHDAAQ